MMEHTLDYIHNKPTDFKLCKKNKHINWYENKECVQCGDKKFITSESAVVNWANAESIYLEKDGFDESSIGDTEYQT